MARIKKIVDSNGNMVFIRNHTKAVFDDAGNSVESRLQSVEDLIATVESTVENLSEVANSNFQGVFASVNELPIMTSSGWALVGQDITALTLYVYRPTQTQWVAFSATTYDFTDFSTLSSQFSLLESELSALKLKISGDGVDELVEYGDATWTWGSYCTPSGSLSSSTYWGRKAFALSEGQTISVSTKGSGAGIITQTENDTDFTVLVSVPNNVSTYNTYTYTATDDCSVTVFVRHNTSDAQPLVEVSATSFGADTAKGTSFDNTQSGLASSNVQDAIDEIMESSNALEVANGGTGTLDISDENGYVITRFQGGHIKTKNFDSALALGYDIIKEL